MIADYLDKLNDQQRAAVAYAWDVAISSQVKCAYIAAPYGTIREVTHRCPCVRQPW